MDDLIMLREVRAAEPGPSAAETTAARNALLAAIEAAGRSPSGRRDTRPRSATRRAPRRRIWGRFNRKSLGSSSRSPR
jgi:hypothetical protein